VGRSVLLDRSQRHLCLERRRGVFSLPWHRFPFPGPPCSLRGGPVFGVHYREHLGNTAYRYPKLHGQHPTEDWFNHVIPALMLLRTFAQYAPLTGCAVEKFSIDVQSSTGYNPITGVGASPLPSDQI